MADDQELWQIASLMRKSPHEVANDPDEMNRRIIQARYEAAREGRELDPDEVFNGMSEAQINRVVPSSQK